MADIEQIPKHQRRKSSWRKQKSKLNTFRLTLRIIFFLANTILWIISILSILGGLMLGFSTQTIGYPPEPLDLTLTTPATIFIMYGILGVPVTTAAWFASMFSKNWLIIIYLLLAIGPFVFDPLFGINMFFSMNAFQAYLANTKASMQQYGLSNSTGTIGIIPVNSTLFWDRFQIMGKCCGLKNFEDWIQTPIGKDFSLPYSCCNDEYINKECGELVFRHPNSNHHTLSDMINLKGCLEIFPNSVIEFFNEAQYVGIIIGVLQIITILLALILLTFQIVQKYRNKFKIAPESQKLGKQEFDVQPSDFIMQRIEQRLPSIGKDDEINPQYVTGQNLSKRRRVTHGSNGPKFSITNPDSEPEEFNGEQNMVTRTHKKSIPGSNKLTAATALDADHAPIKKRRARESQN